MIRLFAILGTLALTAACSSSDYVRNGPQSESPSGGGVLATPITVATASVQPSTYAPSSTQTVVITPDDAASRSEINAGAEFGARAGLIIANALFR